MRGLGAVVLNYRTPDQTLALVSGLIAIREVDHIYVVDNASRDGSAEALCAAAEEFEDRVSFIQSDVNLGYSGGNNLGLRALQVDGYEFALVMNPDVEIAPRVVEELLSFMVGNDDAAVVSPAMHEDGRAVEYRSWVIPLGRSATVEARNGRLRRRFLASRLCVQHFSGACFIARICDLESVGWLPEDQFLYGEEVHVTAQLRQCGKEVSTLSSAIAIHRHGESIGSAASFSMRTSTALYNSTLSAVLVTRKNWPIAVPGVLLLRSGMALLAIARRDPMRAGAVFRGVRRSMGPPLRGEGK